MTDKDDFNLQEAIDRYASHLAHDITSRRRRAAVKQEYADHLEDAIYAYTLQGMEEKEAYHRACEDLGDASKVQTMLAVVHNKDRLPRWVKYPLIVFTAVLVAVLYFLIENESFRDWYVLLLQLGVLTLCGIGVYYLVLFFRAVGIRRAAIRKLLAYAKQNGHTLRIAHPYRSLVRRTTRPELIYEAEDKRYIISLFATIRKKKTLHLTDNGLYSYSAKIGYGLLIGGIPYYRTAMPGLFRPKNIAPMPNAHSHVVDLPEGVHLMPDVRYEEHYSPDKQNINVLMLNPIPFDVDYLRDGHIEKVRDDALLGDVRLWSASGFLSYIEGERIKKRH